MLAGLGLLAGRLAGGWGLFQAFPVWRLGPWTHARAGFGFPLPFALLGGVRGAEDCAWKVKLEGWPLPFPGVGRFLGSALLMVMGASESSYVIMLTGGASIDLTHQSR